MKAPTRNSERMIGVPNRVAMPDLQVRDDDRDARLVFRLRHRVAAHQRDQHGAQTRNDTASMRNAHVRPTVLASRPAPAKPIAVEPNDGDREERVGRRELLVAGHLRDEAVVGRVEELLDAGVQEQQERTARAARWPRSRSRARARPTMTAWMRQVAMRIRLRSCRSTYTPASRPTTRLGMAVAISVRPTASADSVSR